jgi:hypothetical protein
MTCLNGISLPGLASRRLWNEGLFCMEGNVLLEMKRNLVCSLYRRLRINPWHYAEAWTEYINLVRQSWTLLIGAGEGMMECKIQIYDNYSLHSSTRLWWHERRPFQPLRRMSLTDADSLDGGSARHKAPADTGQNRIDTDVHSPADHSDLEVWGMNVFARSNTGIVGSNLTQGMNVCVPLFCIGSGLALGWSPIQGVIPTV